MARKASPSSPGAIPVGSPRERVIDALMALAAEKRFREIGLAEVAERAGVSLADLRDLFPSTGAILAAFSKRIDRQVLEGVTDDLASEPARERVLDIMMRRFDLLQPYREALRSVRRDLRGDPLAMAALNGVALNSHRFMLSAAGIDTQDHLGTLKLQGAVAVFARAFDTFLDDDEPDLARTMARLDRELGRGERVLRLADDLHALAAPFRAFMRAACDGRRRFRSEMRERRRSPRERDEGGEEVATI